MDRYRYQQLVLAAGDTPFAGTDSAWGIPVELFGEDRGFTRVGALRDPDRDFYQGSFTYLFFVNDDDATAAAEVAFANIVITTPNPS